MKQYVVAVGMFDGVHRGHLYVLDRLKEIASQKKLIPAVVTFPNHPRSIIDPEKPKLLLTDIDTKVELIHRAGIDKVIVIPFTNELRQLTAAQFVQTILSDKLNVHTLLLGHDNGFGSDRLHSPLQYAQILSPLGISVEQCDACPHIAVSSTAIRNALCEGDIEKANSLFGRNYTIEGPVVKGRQIGRQIGFPTANIATDPTLLLPRNGVYAAQVTSLSLPAVVNIGTAPTVTDGSKTTIEVHIITDIAPKSLDLYGKTLKIEILRHIRNEKKFADIDQLQAAIADDRATALSYLTSKS